MADVQDKYGAGDVVYLVDDAVVTDANPPAVAADQLAQPGGRGFPLSDRIASQRRSNAGEETRPSSF